MTFSHREMAGSESSKSSLEASGDSGRSKAAVEGVDAPEDDDELEGLE